MSRNRRADWRRIKGKYSYTTEEAARALNVHRNTVRNWVRSGALLAMTGWRPHPTLGPLLVEFLKRRRLAQNRKCGLGELYCLKCRAPRKPLADLIEHRPMTSGRTTDCGYLLDLRKVDAPLCREPEFRGVAPRGGHSLRHMNDSNC